MYELRTCGFRCVLRWLLLALALGALSAHAAIPPIAAHYKYSDQEGVWFDSADAAAASYATKASKPPSVDDWTVVGSCVGASCDFLRTRRSTGQVIGSYNFEMGRDWHSATCPPNSTGTTSCVCDSPYYENAAHTACVAPRCIAGSQGFYRGAVTGSKVNPFNSCQGGCVTLVTPRLDLGVSVTTGIPVKTYATYELYRKAEECDLNNTDMPDLPSDGVTTPTQPTPEPPCPDGQQRAYLADNSPTCVPKPVDKYCPSGYTYGQVNGKDVCISQGGTTPTSSSPPVVTKTGSLETRETSTTQVNPDGSTTTTKNTSDGRGGGSTTVIQTSADGKSTTTTITAMVGSNTSTTATGGGECVEGTAGCAQLGTATNGTVNKSDVNVGAVTPDSLGGFAIGRSCPQGQTFHVFGQSYALSYAQFCDAAPLVKPLVVLMAALVAMGIVYAALTAKT